MNRRQFFSVLTAAAAATMDGASGGREIAPGYGKCRNGVVPWVFWERVRFQAGAELPARVKFFDALQLPAPFDLSSIGVSLAPQTLLVTDAWRFADHSIEFSLQGIVLASGRVPLGELARASPAAIASQVPMLPVRIQPGERCAVELERFDFECEAEGGGFVRAAPAIAAGFVEIVCALHGILRPLSPLTA